MAQLKRFITLHVIFCVTLLPHLTREEEKLKEMLTDEEIVQRIDAFIEAGLKCHNYPGMAVSVVRKGEVLMAKGYGYKTTDRTEPVTNTTLFGVASLSKAFAATLIMKLIEKNNNTFSLRSKIGDILNNNHVFYDDLRSRYATLEDILTHRMGVPSNNMIRFDDKLTRASLVGRLKYLKPTGEFRASYYYSNLMYGLATYIAELYGGDSWENLVKSEIFDPLDMTSSTFATTADPNNIDLAQGYVDLDGELFHVPFEYSKKWGLLCGSGCVMSNAVDMTKWMLFNLKGGQNEQGRQIVTTDSLDNVFKPLNSIPSPPSDKFWMRPETPVSMSVTNYGMGWKIGHYRGCPMVRHSGSTFGYRALLTFLPKCNHGVFLALSGTDPDYLFRTNVHLYIMDLLLGHEPWLNATTLCSFPEPWHRKDTSLSKWAEVSRNLTTHRNLQDYTGVYSNKAYGSLSIYVNEASNALLMEYGYSRFMLFAKTEKDQFFAEGTGMLENIRRFSTLQFGADEGDSTIMTLTVPSFEKRMPPVFQKQVSGANNANSWFPFRISVILLVVIAMTMD